MFKIENLNVGQNPILCHNICASLSGICSLCSDNSVRESLSPGFASNDRTSVEYIIYKQWVIVLLYYAIFEIIACLINNQVYSLFDLV
jgi:hypothetical protein